MLLERKQ
jgi:hypothetical protein